MTAFYLYSTDLEYKTATFAKGTRSQAYVAHRSEFKNKITMKKYEHNRSRLTQANGDTKQLSKIMNEILNKDRSEITYTKENAIVYDDDKINALFSENFSSGN